MAKWIIAAGAAALALTVPALAAQDKGNGGGKGGAKAERGGGGGHKAAPSGGGGAQKDSRGRGGGGQQAARGSGGGGQQAARGGGGGGQKAERQARVAQNRGAERQVQRVDRGGGKNAERQVARVDGGANKVAKAQRRDNVRADRNRDAIRETRIVSRNPDRRDARDLRLNDGGGRLAGFDNVRNLRGLYDNCPPGLARKGNGCLPPGQAKRMIGAALPFALASQRLHGPYSQWYRDNDQYYYRDDGDYIYRVNRQGGLIDALFPYQDRDYSYYDVGTAYPADYNFYNVPQQYQSYYADGDDYNYRYGDGAIYQVDRSDNMISSIVALLAGDLAVGQQMPGNYDVYNVPVAYRDRYYDTAEAEYRYNDGYIYQADPKTQLITAVIDALV